MAEIINLDSYEWKGNENLLVDTNVWLYIFSPYNAQDDKGYSDFLNDVIEKDIKIYINDLIISEYINRICRIGYNKYLRKNKLNPKKFPYKNNYRPTSDFAEIYAFALQSLREDILPLTCIIHSDREIIDQSVKHAIAEDFNDSVLIKIAVKNNLDIVSHDRDFHKYEENFKLFCN